MQDYFNALFSYLVWGIILWRLFSVVYKFIKFLFEPASQHAEQPSAEERPTAPLPPVGRPSTDRAPTTWPAAPQATPPTQPGLQAAMTAPLQRMTPQPTAQKRPCKQTDRVLSRYSGWKKAMVIRELIQPYV